MRGTGIAPAAVLRDVRALSILTRQPAGLHSMTAVGSLRQFVEASPVTELGCSCLWHQQAPTQIPTTGLSAFIADPARHHGVAYVRDGRVALAEVVTHLADDEVMPDETENLVIAMRRANAIDDPTMLSFLGTTLTSCVVSRMPRWIPPSDYRPYRSAAG